MQMAFRAASPRRCAFLIVVMAPGCELVKIREIGAECSVAVMRANRWRNEESRRSGEASLALHERKQASALPD